jgi:hypothetical protein
VDVAGGVWARRVDLQRQHTVEPRRRRLGGWRGT